MQRKITTAYVNPPIPVNGFDWCAQYADCDGYYAGWGATEELAISDLKRCFGDELECAVCGDSDCSPNLGCETGDGA